MQAQPCAKRQRAGALHPCGHPALVARRRHEGRALAGEIGLDLAGGKLAGAVLHIDRDRGTVIRNQPAVGWQKGKVRNAAQHDAGAQIFGQKLL